MKLPLRMLPTPLSKRLRAYPGDADSWRRLPVVASEDELLVGGWQVMQAWETPLMTRLAQEVSRPGNDVLEIGFGMGISAQAIVGCGCRSYTVIESHPDIAAKARAWADEQEIGATVVEGSWEHVVPKMAAERYDGILFDTYPMTRDERGRNHFPFIPLAPRLLRPHGRLTLYSDETSAFRSEHLALLLAHFERVTLVKVTGLRPPRDCEYWQNDTMVIPVAIKVAGGTN